MIYTKTKDYTLYNGKMQDVLDNLEENSVDSIITDPPYELNFMNKGWDNQGIAFQPDTWKHCYRVLKDGGYLLAFGGSRTFHRIACAIEDAGFEIRDTIMWLYGSGFPKSMDISKQIDKKGGNNYSIEFSKDLKKARISRKLTMKYCDDKYCNGSTNWSWYEGRVAGVRVPDYETYLEIVKDFPELEKYRELIKEAEREVIGQKESGANNCYKWLSEGLVNNMNKIVDITLPSTDLAKKWNGWGTCLKPAYEPIIVARKPFKGSLVDNVIENGVGGINIDECRVAFNGDIPQASGLGRKKENHTSYSIPSLNQKWEANNIGRFPANVILTYDDTDFDEVCGGMPDTKSNIEIPNQKHTFKGNKDAFQYGYKMRYGSGFNDEGSASRYFYCAKASKKDRDDGLDVFITKTHAEINNRKEGSAGSERGYGGGTKPFLSVSSPRKNIHPTVKPIELMQYLVRLVTPKNATVLDCFMGSGSTGKAVMFENRERNANYHFIGIEMTEEYLPICKARIDYALNKYEYDFQKQLQEEKNKGQLSIFDFMEN